MSANLIPITSDGGFTSGGNITAGSYASPAPSINGFSSIVFADGSTQTTAYETAQQYGYFNEMTYGGERADGEAIAIDSGGNTYVSYTYYDNNDGTRYSGVAKFNTTGSRLWSQNIKSNTGSPDYSEITSLEYTTVGGTPYLVAIGTYYENNSGLNNGFMWLINPDDGTVGTEFDTEVVGSGYGLQLQDAVFGTDGNGDPFTVMVGNSNNENLIKTFTPIAPSTTDKLYISWAEFNASGLANNTELTINTPSYAGAYMNAATAVASPDGTGNGIYLTISSTEAGNYVITRVTGWSGVINGWSSPQAVRMLGSSLGGTDGVNDLTFDFDPVIFADNSQNINAAVSNIVGTPVSNVFCSAYNGFDWSTLIGTPTNFNQSVGDQGYIGRVGNTNSWSKSVGESNYDEIQSVVVDSDDNIYVSGYYYDNISRSAIVIKYDVTGAQQWAVYVDPSAHMNINQYSIDLLADGNLITVGDYAVVTKIDKTDGSIIWQVDIDDSMSWNANFRGTATPDGDYIFTNYEDNNYRMYVMRLSGTDGSVQWTKEIKDLFNGTDGEIYPENQWSAQYIDCNATQVSIGATRYNNSASPNYVGLVINFPSNGDNSDGVYGQYIIGSYSFSWNTLSTTATAASVTAYSATESAGPASPTATSVDLVINTTTIGGGAVTTVPTSIANGTSYANIADADGNLVISVNNDSMNWTFASDRYIYGKASEDVTIAVVDDNNDGYEVRQIVVDAIGGTLYARTGLDRSSYSIELNQNSSGQQWTFDGANLTVQQDSNIYGYDRNLALVSMYAGSGNPIASLKSVSHINDPNVFTSIDATHSSAKISTYADGSQSGTANTWIFDNAGKLTVPGTVAGPVNGNLVLAGGAGGPSGQFATSNGPTYGYGGPLAIFVQGDFITGSLSSVQVGGVVVDGNGTTGNVITVAPNTYGAGTTGITLDIIWSGVTPYTYYAGYGADGNVTIQADTANWTFSANGVITNPVIPFANLPLATTPGLRAFISDGNLAPIGNFGVQVSGGGGNYIPVFSDGANWCIG